MGSPRGDENSLVLVGADMFFNRFQLICCRADAFSCQLMTVEVDVLLLELEFF